MKTRCFFIMAFLCLLFLNITTVQAQVLNKKISLTVKDATLQQVLQKIQQQYAVRFSYVNNSLPTQQRFSADVQDKPLAEVLDVLLSETDIGYLERNGQVIIKKGLPKKQPKTTTLKKQPAPSKPAPRGTTVVETKVTTTVKPDGTVANKVETKTKPPVSTSANEETVSEKEPVTPEEPADNAAEPVPSDQTNTTAPDSADTEKGIKITIKNIFPKFPAKPSTKDTAEIRPFHIGFIYPLSTNGIYANRYVNRLSLHALVGTAAGLQGLEFSGFGSMEKNYVNGFQFSGFFNLVGNPRALNNGYSLRGGQFAGFLNVSGGNSYGIQSAGFLNVTKNMQGAQLAGFLNVADTLQGVQVAGFLNKASYVKGSQIGIINVADTLTGVPIGLISIVKRGGYRRLELFYADDFEANAIFKMGVHKFYNFLGLSAQLDDKKRWAYGAGFGAEWRPAKWFYLNTDLAAYHVMEESYEDFPNGFFGINELNLLNKFRLLATIPIAKHLALFGGPTYNVFVSRYQEAGESEVGSLLKTKTFYDHTSAGGTNVKMWIGFNAGIRF